MLLATITVYALTFCNIAFCFTVPAIISTCKEYDFCLENNKENILLIVNFIITGIIVTVITCLTAYTKSYHDLNHIRKCDIVIILHVMFCVLSSLTILHLQDYDKLSKYIVVFGTILPYVILVMFVFHRKYLVKKYEHAILENEFITRSNEFDIRGVRRAHYGSMN